MPPHLSHKIAWEKLGAMYAYQASQRPISKHARPLPHHPKELQHIARVFVATLREFKETDKTSEADKKLYDARMWGEYYEDSLRGLGFMMGIYDSLLWGYIELNLVLLDPIRFGPLVMPEGKCTYAMGYLLNDHDNGHDDDVANHLAQVFIDKTYIKPLTPEVLDVLHDHVKLLFKSMYLISGENALLKDDVVITKFFCFFCWNKWIPAEP